MNISSAVFDRSAPDLASCPDESLPEFAFIGRSNVGKSSLLNMLAGEKGLARVSPVPGFTKLINVFTMNKRWRLVDLPGYGYAHVAREDKARFSTAVLDYLEHRPNLNLVFALIDCGLTPQAIDVEFVEWLVSHAVPFVLVFTKTDRLATAAVQANVAAFNARISAWFEQPPAVFTCSAQTGEGRPELLAVIDAATKAIAATTPRSLAPSQNSSPFDSPVAAAKTRKRRPDLNRPW